MKYDVSMHIPKEVDGLLEAYRKPDVALMQRCLKNIRNLIKDKKFQSDLDDYAKKRLEQITNLTKKADDAVKMIITTKNFNELYIDVQEMGKDLTLAMDSIEQDYWDHVKDYITLYLHEEQKVEDDEGDGE